MTETQIVSAPAASPPAAPAVDETAGSPAWRRNLAVCLFGSFTTLVAMTLLLPFLPLYVAQLGVKTPEAVVQWSGVAFGATFFGAALLSPVWGKLADRYGRKPILIRASLGMAVTMSLLGLAQNVYQLVGLRLLAGFVGGYSSGSIVLIATQAPKHRAGWALGTLSTGVMAGSLIGPLVGGVLPGLIGVRATFFAAGGMIFLAFLGTTFFIREDPADVARRRADRKKTPGGAWSMIPDKRPVFAMLLTALMLMLATMSIEPIITVYVGQLLGDSRQVALVAGIVMSASALGSVLAASRLGKLADRLGAWTVVMGCLVVTALLLIPQAFVTSAWQLIALRFLMGMALAGLMPSINSLIRHSVPVAVVGNILGYSTSAQFAGQVVGPLLGGFVGAHLGMRAVFITTSALMLCTVAYNWVISRRVSPP